MPGHDRNACSLGCFHGRGLFDGVKAVDDDAIGIQRHGLAEGSGAA